MNWGGTWAAARISAACAAPRPAPFTLADAHRLGELEPLAGNRRRAHVALRSSAQPAAGDALGDRRRIYPGTDAQRRPGQLAGVFFGSLVKVFASQRELVGIAKRVAGTLFQPVMVLG